MQCVLNIQQQFTCCIHSQPGQVADGLDRLVETKLSYRPVVAAASL